MTPQEAIKRIEDHNRIHSKRERFAIHITEALHMAVDALKKQTPQKANYESMADRGCPNCDAYIPFDALNDRIEDAPKFCRECGQALDWSECIE